MKLGLVLKVSKLFNRIGNNGVTDWGIYGGKEGGEGKMDTRDLSSKNERHLSSKNSKVSDE